MKLRTTLLFAVGVSGLVGLVGLYSRLTTIDSAQHLAITDYLRQLDAQDTRWNENALRIRLSLNTHYDDLATPIATMTRLADDLNGLLGQLDGQTALQQQLADYQQLTAEKVDLMEQFKGANAILSNSLHFLPRAIQDAQTAQLAASGNAGVVTLLSTLKDQLLEYNLLGQDTAQAAAAATWEQLRQQLAAQGGGQRSAALNIALNHARAILQQKARIDDQLDALLALPTGAKLGQLLTDYSAFHQQRVAQTEALGPPLIGLAALLTLGLLLVGYRLQRSYRALDRANAQLSQMNEALEERVQERTRELSQTLAELRESEAQLIQSEKMASLGQMIAGVAHEINTPLAYTRSNISLMAEQLPQVAALVAQAAQLDEAGVGDGPVGQMLALLHRLDPLSREAKALQEDGLLEEMVELSQVCLQGLDNIAGIVKSLKDFSRLDRDRLETVDLNRGLADVLVIANNALKQKAHLVQDLAPLPAVRCAPSQINQVFLNLVMNAVQALPEPVDGQPSGTLTLTSRDLDDRVQIQVHDTGKGIPEAHLSKIFDPFFTTKPVGQGTGLGLSIVYKIIQAHGGQIQVESTVGVGTCFTVTLPKHAEIQRVAA